MFKKLGGRKKRFWTPTTVVTSIVIHALLVAGAYATSKGIDPTKKKTEELVQYVEVEEEKPKEPEPEEEKPEEPPPPEPEAEAPPPVAKGFQELVPPTEPPAVIPDVNPNEVAVKVEDFSGVGKAGGVAEGVTTGVAQDVSERETPPEEGTYDISAVEVRPELSNRQEVARQLVRNYPRLLGDAGISGTVQLRLRVNPDGRVDASSIQVLSASHDGFTDAAKKVVERMRFSPAKVNNKAVPVWVEIPIQFQMPS